ncbi:MAG TPA: YsnF/AvaK domain-containing protein [Candidatus Tectomicrobia bacterium]|nr:YsnF/AvaK domain-containing protein [Candidatus Tectomicrobia bacterium]
MGSPEIVRVAGPGSLRGTIDTAAWPLDGSRAQVLVQLEGGASLLVPRNALAQQDDGSYYLALDSVASERRGAGGRVSDSPLVLPVIQEALEVHTTPVETGRVRIRKVVHEREELVDPPLLHDEVVVERVPINRVIEGPISVRSEEDTLVIPLLEEVLVIEKRLLLKEEVRITKRRMETHRPQRVTLRREEAVVERVNREGDETNPCT